MDHQPIHILQADIIFKALHYVCKREGVEMNENLESVFSVLAEMNPNDTHVSDARDVMENLAGFIKNHEDYKEYFDEEEEEDVD